MIEDLIEWIENHWVLSLLICLIITVLLFRVKRKLTVIILYCFLGVVALLLTMLFLSTLFNITDASSPVELGDIFFICLFFTFVIIGSFIRLSKYSDFIVNWAVGSFVITPLILVVGVEAIRTIHAEIQAREREAIEERVIQDVLHQKPIINSIIQAANQFNDAQPGVVDYYVDYDYMHENPRAEEISLSLFLDGNSNSGNGDDPPKVRAFLDTLPRTKYQIQFFNDKYMDRSVLKRYRLYTDTDNQIVSCKYYGFPKDPPEEKENLCRTFNIPLTYVLLN